MTEAEADKISKDAYADIQAACEFAENSPEPSLDTIEEGVYAPW
jgi:pyruvate dehydrogenase E1 component alpha subunit